MKIDIVFLFYKQQNLWKKVRDGLRENQEAINQVLIVNDGPWEEPKLETSLACSYLEHEHKGRGGPAFGVNQGVQAATTEFVLVTAGDIYIPQGLIEADLKLVKPGKLIVRGVTRISYPEHCLLERDWRNPNADLIRRARRWWKLMQGNYALFSRKDFLAIGGFNEELGALGYADEDREFAARWCTQFGEDSIVLSQGECVYHLGPRDLTQRPPIRAREMLAYSLGKLYNGRYNLFSQRNPFDSKAVNIAHTAIPGKGLSKDGYSADVQLDCDYPENWMYTGDNICKPS